MVLGFTAYFIAGWYLNRITISKQVRTLIYIFAIASAVFTAVLTKIISVKRGDSVESYYSYLTVNVLLESIGIFTLFKYGTYKSKKLNCFIQKLSKYSFGAYLVHVLVMNILRSHYGINTLSFGNPLLGVIVISIMVIIVSFVVSAVINHIPVLKKYIV